MKKTCLWCGGNFYEGFECKVCAKNEYPDFVADCDFDDQPDVKGYDLEFLEEYGVGGGSFLKERFVNGTFPELDDDLVHEPDHYSRWPIEPITFIMRNGFEFWRGNIVKYAARAGYKIYDGKSQEDSEITDLEKVIRYAEMRINQIKGETKL